MSNNDYKYVLFGNRKVLSNIGFEFESYFILKKLAYIVNYLYICRGQIKVRSCSRPILPHERSYKGI